MNKNFLVLWLVALVSMVSYAPTEAAEDKECVAGWTASVSPNIEKYTVYLNGDKLGDAEGVEYRTGLDVCPTGTYTVTATNVHGLESIHSVEYVVGAAPEPATDLNLRIRVDVTVSVEVGE